jgi:hypothetical protein
MLKPNTSKQAQGRKLRRVAGTPEVGIFWVLGKRILLDTTPLTEAETWAEFKTHPRDHITLWGVYQSAGVVPEDQEYEEVPRGRVSYDAKAQHYLFLADRCILKNKSLVNRIMGKMNLPQGNTKINSDAHYRCSKCTPAEAENL